MKSIQFLLFALLFAVPQLSAQDEGDLLSLLDDGPTTDYTTASFKTNRVINGHSLENTARGVMDMKISHRFTPLRFGLYDIFGLDNASIRIGLDYGITDRLMVGFGRSSYEKVYDGFAKYKILRQSTGKRRMPITLTYLADIQCKTVKFDNPERENYFSSRLFYTHQVLIGRKFSDRLTLQLMPTVVHRNLVATTEDANSVLAVGVAGRVKLTKRVALNAEYYHVLPNQIVSQPFYQTLSLGLDIETGGHVFQLHFTNSPDMTYRGFITESPEPWFMRNDDGRLMSGIRFGFNVSRVFTVRKPKGT
jgi:hypothetical protein